MIFEKLSILLFFFAKALDASSPTTPGADEGPRDTPRTPTANTGRGVFSGLSKMSELLPKLPKFPELPKPSEQEQKLSERWRQYGLETQGETLPEWPFERDYEGNMGWEMVDGVRRLRAPRLRDVDGEEERKRQEGFHQWNIKENLKEQQARLEQERLLAQKQLEQNKALELAQERMNHKDSTQPPKTPGLWCTLL